MRRSHHPPIRHNGRSCRIDLLGMAVLAAILWLAIGPARPEAAEQTVETTISVPKGAQQGMRLTNLPEGTTLDVTVETGARMTVLLAPGPALAAATGSNAPLFKNETSHRLRFSVVLPASGTYLLVLDNTAGDSTQDASITIYARHDGEPPETAMTPAPELDRQFTTITQRIQRVFKADTLEIKAAHCGTANAVARANTVVLCTELVQMLITDLGGQERARDAMMFILFHELGHVLLAQWGYPFSDNEEIADEFATTLMVMFGQAERARTQAEYFASLSSEKEAEATLERYNRHPLSIQRARNILDWLADDTLARKWQPIFIPHMQTDFLRQMASANAPWIDHDAVARELASRGE